jgi:hypothetical protein
VQTEAIHAKIIPALGALIACHSFFIAQKTHLEVILKLKNECYDKRVKGSVLPQKKSEKQKRPLSCYGTNTSR